MTFIYSLYLFNLCQIVSVKVQPVSLVSGYLFSFTFVCLCVNQVSALHFRFWIITDWIIASLDGWLSCPGYRTWIWTLILPSSSDPFHLCMSPVSRWDIFLMLISFTSVKYPSNWLLFLLVRPNLYSQKFTWSFLSWRPALNLRNLDLALGHSILPGKQSSLWLVLDCFANGPRLLCVGGFDSNNCRLSCVFNFCSCFLASIYFILDDSSVNIISKDSKVL